MFPRRKTKVTLEGRYYLLVMAFLLSGAMLREVNLLLLLFGLMLGPLIYSWRSVAVAVRHVRVRRHAPATATAGQPLTVSIEAVSRRRRRGSWLIAVEDAVTRVEGPSGDAPRLPAAVLFDHIPPGQSRRVAYQGRLPSRGRYRLGPLAVSTRFPLGLLRRSIHVEQPDTIVVYPRLGKLTGRWARQRREAAEGSRSLHRPLGIREGDYHGLRDWRPGDSRRWIHWRTTARRGELMVRQFEQHRNHDLLLVVELWQPPEADADARARVETAVSLAATIVAEHCRQGASELRLAVVDSRPAVVGGPAAPALLRDALERLAIAEADPRDRLGDQLAAQLAGLSSATDVVLVGTRPVDLADSERFAAVWGDGALREWIGRMLVIEAGSPELPQWYEAPEA